MKFKDILSQPEGRKLEFKETLPSKSDLAKTVISFANDAGGELYFGIGNNPRVIIGIDENNLFSFEEKISNIIHDNCSPLILPEISFLNIDGKHVIRTQISKGSNPPYHLKTKKAEDGTYIRVGSSNRLASAEIIAGLERQKRNISFDSELSWQKTIEDINILFFKQFYLEKTSEELTIQALQKLELLRDDQGRKFPTNALILLSDDELRKQHFPYAKIECARFKGDIPGNFIDQKTIDTNVAIQPEQAYHFVMRHISQGTTDYTGVYRNDRWEYPVIAIREVIRNAVIHRDYSLTGMDIKIAIFDDKIEITSPGKLLPTVDFSEMEAGQSDIRNKVLAPTFKRLGIIEQWGNGLKLISSELRKYPEIGLKWDEPGVAFRVTFYRKNFTVQQELKPESQQDLQQESKLDSQPESQPELQQESKLYSQPESQPEFKQESKLESQQESKSESLFIRVLRHLNEKPLSKKEMSELLGQKSISGQLNGTFSKLLVENLVKWTIPEKKNSSKQKYQITQEGIDRIKQLNHQPTLNSSKS